MRIYRPYLTKVIDSVKCNRCGREDDDIMEMQEYIAVDFVGGYNSVFGDGIQLTGDFCQHCVKEMMGTYLVEKDDEE